MHTPNLLNEIADHALTSNSGVLKVPLNQFRLLLVQVANRASQLNDPVLNQLMCELTLYEEADPQSKAYNKQLLKKAEAQFYKHLEKGVH